MSVNLKKERYKIKDLIGKEKEHVIIEDTEKIPEGQPEAEAVIDVEPTAKVEDIKLINDRVIVEGVLDVRVFYTESEFEDSDEENQVFIFHFAPEPFTAFIDIPGVQSDMKADIKISVSGINVDIIESNLLRKQADLDITALVFQKKDLELPVKATAVPPGEIDIETQPVNIKNITGERVEEVSFEREVFMSEGKPDICKIINYWCEVEVDDYQVSQDNVTVEGVLNSRIMYQTEFIDHPVSILDLDTENFTVEMEVEGATEDSQVQIETLVESVNVEQLDERGVNQSVTVKVKTIVYNLNEIEVVTGIESLTEERLDISSESIEVESMVDQLRKQIIIDEKYILPENSHDLYRILKIMASPSVDRVQVSGEQVFVEGSLNIKVLYEGAGTAADKKPYYVISFEEPVAETLNIDDIELDMKVVSDLKLNNFNIDISDEQSLWKEINAELLIQVLEDKNIEMVKDVVSVSPFVDTENPPSYLFYVVQPGDSISQIARRFNTSEESIAEDNKLTDIEDVNTGQKIYITMGK